MMGHEGDSLHLHVGKPASILIVPLVDIRQSVAWTVELLDTLRACMLRLVSVYLPSCFLAYETPSIN